jgi:hypothetical protein
LIYNPSQSHILTTHRKETTTDVTGYVALDHTNKMIVISFRGSQSIDTWRTNLQFATTTTDICPGCTAHRGFWRSWTDARDSVVPAVKQASSSFPAYKIVTTGHSLGGAVSILAAASLRNAGYNVAMYNFGAPRIGGSKISTYISNQPGGNYRITHWNDPVPKLPLLTMGYVHVSPEYYINKPSQQDVGADDIKVYEGSRNMQGNQKWLTMDIEAHRWYFGRVYKCDPFKTKRGGLAIRGVEEEVEIVATF